jgi:hypothetical protein
MTIHLNEFGLVKQVLDETPYVRRHSAKCRDDGPVTLSSLSYSRRQVEQFSSGVSQSVIGSITVLSTRRMEKLNLRRHLQFTAAQDRGVSETASRIPAFLTWGRLVSIPSKYRSPTETGTFI